MFNLTLLAGHGGRAIAIQAPGPDPDFLFFFPSQFEIPKLSLQQNSRNRIISENQLTFLGQTDCRNTTGTRRESLHTAAYIGMLSRGRRENTRYFILFIDR